MKLYATLISICILILGYGHYKQEHRLNEHKRLLIAQQKQINQLIRYESMHLRKFEDEK